MSQNGPVQKASPLLSVSDLRVRFGRGREANEVVHGISFSVDPGETVAIVGGSGSGKSVTAMSLLGLLDRKRASVSGRAALDGRDLLALTEQQLRHVRGLEVGMIFQEPMTSLNPVLTIGYQLAEVLRRHRGMSRREARVESVALLEKVRIPSASRRLEEYPHSLS
ncbi:ATP-binding cassette domain-containing protein, partial [Rhizobiaceae sp. 2RAB30]